MGVTVLPRELVTSAVCPLGVSAMPSGPLKPRMTCTACVSGLIAVTVFWFRFVTKTSPGFA